MRYFTIKKVKTQYRIDYFGNGWFCEYGSLMFTLKSGLKWLFFAK